MMMVVYKLKCIKGMQDRTKLVGKNIFGIDVFENENLKYRQGICRSK